MRDLPWRPRCGDKRCRSPPQRVGWRGYAATTLRAVLVRTVPSRSTDRDFAVERRTEHALAKWLRGSLRVKLPDGSTMTATDNPPSLVHLADKTTREWIYAWMKDPLAYAASTAMADFNLSDNNRRDISAFLISDSTARSRGYCTNRRVSFKDASRSGFHGASLYGESKRFCASCHATQNAAGTLSVGTLAQS